MTSDPGIATDEVVLRPARSSQVGHPSGHNTVFILMRLAVTKAPSLQLDYVIGEATGITSAP